MRRYLILIVLLLMSTCDKAPEPAKDVTGDTAPPGVDFAAPEGVAVTADLVFVANANFYYEGQDIVYGNGFLTVVNRSDRKVVRTVAPPACTNAQAVAVSGKHGYLLCSGATSYDKTSGIVKPTSGAALFRFAATGASAGTTDLVFPLDLVPDRPLVGYPSSLAITPDGKYAYAGSGTAAAIFKFDLASGKVLRGVPDPIALGDLSVQDGINVEAGGAGILYAASFNRDMVFAIDTGTDSQAVTPFQSIQVGKAAAMEGAQDLAFRQGGTPDLFVLMGLASSVSAVSTVMGSGGVENDFAKTGLYPNRIVIGGDLLIMVNSGDNNLTAVSIQTRKSAGTVALPTNTNPYDIAITGSGVSYVTGLMSNSLFEVDLGTGKVAEIK